MNRYDSDQTPTHEEWLELDEQMRNGLVEDSSVMAHTAFQGIVENQKAENFESTARPMARFTTVGWSRPEAVHAIASVVTEPVHDLVNAKADANNAKAIDDAAMERLIASAWRSKARLRSNALPMPESAGQNDAIWLTQERRKGSHKDRKSAEYSVLCAAGMPVRKREWHTRGGDACNRCADDCEIKRQRKD